MKETTRHHRDRGVVASCSNEARYFGVRTSESKPVGRSEVKQREIQHFLNPLSIKKIPIVGPEIFQTFSRLGIKTIKTLSEMPVVGVLQQMIGKNGSVLWKKTHAIDEKPVIPYSERKSISTEHTFSQDTIDIDNTRSYST